MSAPTVTVELTPQEASALLNEATAGFPSRSVTLNRASVKLEAAIKSAKKKRGES